MTWRRPAYDPMRRSTSCADPVSGRAPRPNSPRPMATVLATMWQKVLKELRGLTANVVAAGAATVFPKLLQIARRVGSRRGASNDVRRGIGNTGSAMAARARQNAGGVWRRGFPQLAKADGVGEQQYEFRYHLGSDTVHAGSRQRYLWRPATRPLVGRKSGHGRTGRRLRPGPDTGRCR